MKIKTNRIIESEIHVDLPLYRKGGAFFYMVSSESECVAVCAVAEYLEIGKRHAGLAWNNDSSVDCTREEFENAFANASYELGKIVMQP